MKKPLRDVLLDLQNNNNQINFYNVILRYTVVFFFIQIYELTCEKLYKTQFVRLTSLKWTEKILGFFRMKILNFGEIWSVVTSNMSGTTHP